jgi:hypothetical protein
MSKKQKPGFFNRLLGKNNDTDKNEDDKWIHAYHMGETLLFHEENPKKALVQFKRSLEIARKTGDRKAEGYSLEMTGRILHGIDNNIKNLQKAIEYSRSILPKAEYR